jgi:ribonuclease BN (tRNA processing enzyme)
MPPWPIAASAKGIEVTARDISEGIVYDAHGVTITAFLVDHGRVKPAYGYRVDHGGHSVALSGDTRPSDNLVAFSLNAASSRAQDLSTPAGERDGTVRHRASVAEATS